MTEHDTGDERELIPVYDGPVEFEGEMTLEAPPRDVQEVFGGDGSVTIESDLPGFEDGDYRPCIYCEGDSLVHVDQYMEHIQEVHGIDP